ncbi:MULTISPECIES: hypothetical protein [Bacillus subtilis group]|uniref:hypothetical protein n=1 Tax=Bacillus TaxID=1386 RepID=UPI0009B7D038|nr:MULTISPECIES: hypothetical protein [Bacillus subtilis group]ARC68654.1 hypothetical protein B34_01212 [Bacillus licheniformis]QEO07784.1 hypothetical protein FLQ07_20555 [Bacillus paralicheniformis]
MPYYDDGHLPEKHLIDHNFCLYLHDVCLSIFDECMEDGYRMSYKIEENGRPSLKGLERTDDFFDWLRANGYEKEANLILKRKMFHAILADFLSYVLESLKASEKGKTAISFTLLRKPFKDNLFYLEWLATHGDELLSLVDTGKIEEYEVGRIRKFKKEKMMNILNEVMKKNEFKELLHFPDDNYMYKLRYDYNAPFGLELMWNSANHLVTTARKIRTKDFNDIFLTEEDFKERWHYFYTKVPLLLLYSTGVVILVYEQLFEKIPLSTKTYNNIFLLVKWYSRVDNELGKKFIEDVLADTRIPLYCDNCEKEILINKDQAFKVQYDWGLECEHCKEIISISRYHFVEVEEGEEKK